jgi:iron complex transport system permease protein
MISPKIGAGGLSLLIVPLIVLLFGLSLMAGKVWVPFQAWGSDDPRWWIVFELRLPRAILGVAIGAVLGLAGAVLQGYLRNPLADPSLIGISASAALGAVASIFFGIAITPLTLGLCAMLGAAGAMLLLGLLVGRSGSAISFILAGTILTSLASALTTLLISLSPNPFAASEIVTWLMGALSDRSFDEVRFAMPFMVAGALLLLMTGRAIDALSLGEAAARSLGVRLGLLQLQIVLGLGLAVGAAVAVAGMVAFVGLIVPHLVRPLVGQRPSALLLPSALAGAALVLAADTLVRLIPGAGEVRLGVVTALIGAPFFFLLLFRMRLRAP